MKLIIDIPKEIKAVIDRNGTNEIVIETIWQAVKNGIPLEQIRQEIDSHCSDNRDRNDGLYVAMKIIDKYR